MGFFQDLREDLSQAVNELMPDEEALQDEGVSETEHLEDLDEEQEEYRTYLSPDICVQRLVSRAPEENTVFCNWGMSWWKIRDMIDEIMETEDLRQGCRCDYLNRDYYFWQQRR